jgi:hypothetical protein
MAPVLKSETQNVKPSVFLKLACGLWKFNKSPRVHGKLTGGRRSGPPQHCQSRGIWGGGPLSVRCQLATTVTRELKRGKVCCCSQLCSFSPWWLAPWLWAKVAQRIIAGSTSVNKATYLQDRT